MRFELTTEQRERFERYVDRSGGPDACHLWTGYCLPQGHGRLGLNGRRELAHRVAWCLAGNEITEEKPQILHDCPGGDNPACCNPRHLWAGTNTENHRDKARKGRGPKSKSGLPFGAKVQQSGRFQARARVDGKQICLGTYDTAEEASAVALKAKHDWLNSQASP